MQHAISCVVHTNKCPPLFTQTSNISTKNAANFLFLYKRHNSALSCRPIKHDGPVMSWGHWLFLLYNSYTANNTIKITTRLQAPRRKLYTSWIHNFQMLALSGKVLMCRLHNWLIDRLDRVYYPVSMITAIRCSSCWGHTIGRLWLLLSTVMSMGPVKIFWKSAQSTILLTTFHAHVHVFMLHLSFWTCLIVRNAYYAISL